MKVNSKILSIPPYISSSWENITSLHLEDKGDKKILVINLTSGSKLEIPGLTAATLLQIFQSHEQYLEDVDKMGEEKKRDTPSFSLGIPLTVNSDEFHQFVELLQDPSKIPGVELPANLMDKISEAIKTMGLDDKWLESSGELLEHPLYQQLKQVFSKGKTEKTEPLDEEIRDEDLRFKEWDILSLSKELYKVTNPLDETEEYQVFLGRPIGCNCGQHNCEHIKAVLKS